MFKSTCFAHHYRLTFCSLKRFCDQFRPCRLNLRHLCIQMIYKSFYTIRLRNWSTIIISHPADIPFLLFLLYQLPSHSLYRFLIRLACFFRIDALDSILFKCLHPSFIRLLIGYDYIQSGKWANIVKTYCIEF